LNRGGPGWARVRRLGWICDVAQLPPRQVET